MRSVSRAAVVCALLVVGGVACGGGGDDEATAEDGSSTTTTEPNDSSTTLTNSDDPQATGYDPGEHGCFADGTMQGDGHDVEQLHHALLTGWTDRGM